MIVFLQKISTIDVYRILALLILLKIYSLLIIKYKTFYNIHYNDQENK